MGTAIGTGLSIGGKFLQGANVIGSQFGANRGGSLKNVVETIKKHNYTARDYDRISKSLRGLAKIYTTGTGTFGNSKLYKKNMPKRKKLKKLKNWKPSKVRQGGRKIKSIFRK